MTNSTDNPPQPVPLKLVTEVWLKNYEIQKTGWLRLLSGSMAPLINTGDQVLVEKIMPAKIAVGDIITFRRDDILVTHRVIRKYNINHNYYFLERADTSRYYSKVDASMLIGRVIKIRKNGGREIVFNTVSWQIFNRVAGLGFYISSTVFLIGRKIPWVPHPIRQCIQKMLAAAKYVQKKVLSSKINSI
jgi:signal peptidase I